MASESDRRLPSPELLTRAAALARKAEALAYCPRSRIGVGACVVTPDGQLFEGNNVESVISGLGTCAERSAIDHAIAHGYYRFSAIVTSRHPCGACLQYLLEFAEVSGGDLPIITLEADGTTVAYVRDLLPHPCGPDECGVDVSRYRKVDA